MKTHNPLHLFMAAWHRRWAKNALIDAREWFMYFDPDWARYHWQLAMNHVRKARRWEKA
jgi:hypothetical protein